MTALEQALNDWQDWGLDLASRPQAVAPVPGGLTNCNYRIDTPGSPEALLLRIHHPHSKRLGIDRAVEQVIVAEVARHQIGRPALYWDPAGRYAVFEWFAARPWTPADFASPSQRKRLWPLLECLAELPLKLPRRRYHSYLTGYWRQIERAGRADDRLHRAWQDFEPRLRAFDQSDWPAHLVHHDLVPANVLDTGERLVLIDWEYAAIGHPGIDIWSLWPEACREPFVADLMGWINALWERLVNQ